ncbi:hypothetical protein FRC14_001406 [Serendipita sp. 396]|nr:hypothetical protein FRC14_001406 [Serendipita sp. 396]KAG8788901.1 hypothetical protein FRC15_001416 [Serendipita sp. 397]KAG8828780.1 hypothetical protein FRC19_000168 [Serendipita sp. 401]KAG8855083.1 hypothetical protein FRB91_002699 [Serendipita sp. 411]KAG8876492.1 hypothetical protein FRC20_001392 [Serendipita sp. 405]KAG9058697.1 hypothetical protein FS842_006034 [Serendipita sp. 407]
MDFQFDQAGEPNDPICISSDEESGILTYTPSKVKETTYLVRSAKRPYEPDTSNQESPSKRRRSRSLVGYPLGSGGPRVLHSSYEGNDLDSDESQVLPRLSGLDFVDRAINQWQKSTLVYSVLPIVTCGRRIPSLPGLNGNQLATSMQIKGVTHEPLVQRHIRTSIRSPSNLPTVFSRLEGTNMRFPGLRLGGSTNVISQCGNIAAIAANTNGVMTEAINASAANREGFIVLSLDSNKFEMLPIMSPAHVQSQFSMEYEMDQSSEGHLIFESVFDVQFDPARPKKLLTSGNDFTILGWNLVESLSAGLCVTRFTDNDSDTTITKYFNARPHHIRFCPSKNHWGTRQTQMSTFAVSDGAGKIHIECYTKESVLRHIDKKPGRQVSSLCWGLNRTETVVFGGTETVEARNGLTAGVQTGFLIHPNGDVADRKYTNSQDEVEQLAVNPQGDIIASLTRKCDSSKINCIQCDQRSISATHTLSLYSISDQAGKFTRKKQSPTLIGSVELPRFSSSDRSDEAGAVVSLAWSPCGTYIAVARDDDFIDIFDSRFLASEPLMRLKHETPKVARTRRPAMDLRGNVSRCCRVLCKYPEHGITGMQWIEGSGYYGGLGLISGGGDGCVRLWDTRKVDTNHILARLETSIASLSIGDISRKECPLIVGDNDGLVQWFTARPS